RVSCTTLSLLTLGGKIGYAFCHWLPYVTGGVAWGDIDFQGRLVEPDDRTWVGSSYNLQSGWFVGVGLEYMLTNHWPLRTQYQYVDLGDTGFTRQDNFGEGFITHRSADVREHVVQVAISYGF